MEANDFVIFAYRLEFIHFNIDYFRFGRRYILFSSGGRGFYFADDYTAQLMKS